MLYERLILVCSFDGCKLTGELAVLNSTRSKLLFEGVEVMKNRIHCRRPNAFSLLDNETLGFLYFVVEGVNIVLDNFV